MLLLQVDVLVRDASEVLDLVRSMKNILAPINRISSEVFSLFPEYLEGYSMEEDLIAMSHVCRSWRKLLIARPSLWVRLDCANTDKTRVYIERSKSSPLELSLYKNGYTNHLNYVVDAILLVVPHISRLEYLSINGSEALQILAPHLSCPIPLLRELAITSDSNCRPTPVLDTMLFNCDLSSLCSLTLVGFVTHLPWKNLSQLTTFVLYLGRTLEDKISITQLLDFLEGARHLRDITLRHFLITMSNAPPGRVVSLPCLKTFTIEAEGQVHPVLLDHLSIPAGASLSMEFVFYGDESPFPDLLPKALENLGNISPISSVDLFFDDFDKRVRLDGPNGGLHMFGDWRDLVGVPRFTVDHRILQSLSCFDLSGTQRLAIMGYESPTVDAVDNSAPYHILSHMKDLRTLTLTRCNNLSFILTLNPDQNPLKCALCPKLEELVLYVKGLESFNIKELMSMAQERASAGMKLASLTVVGLGELLPGREVFKLREYIPHVDYKVGETA